MSGFLKETTFFSTYQFISVTHPTSLSITKSAKEPFLDLIVTDQSRKRIYTNKIDRKHVDFLLCDPATMCPLLGIELDDKSHQRADRQARDEFVDQVFAAAGLPVLHVPAKRGYTVSEISSQLAPYLTTTPQPVVANTAIKPEIKPAPTPESESPSCPKCGSKMLLRTAKSGANAGNRFWGCSNYPTCRSMLPYKE